jgi:hypothetical protein
MDVATLMGISVFVATLVGPVAAVIVARHLEEKKQEYARKIYIFRNLMMHRLHPISGPFVEALNLIEIDFSKDKSVVEAWRRLWHNLGEPVKDYNENQRLLVFQKRRELTNTLISEIAKIVGYRVTDLDLAQSGYSPEGWAEEQYRQQTIQSFWFAIATGTRSFPINNPPIDEQEAESRKLVAGVLTGVKPLKIEIVNAPPGRP